MKRYAEESYQGWRNYPTWAVALWINNDEGLYGYAMEAVEDLRRDFSGRELIQRLAGVFEGLLESMVDQLSTELLGGPLADLLQYAIDEVDHFEIAENFLAD